MTTLPELIVDFNDVDAKRRVLVFLADENARWPLDLGTEVVLRDDDGNSVRGLIAALRKGEALVEPEWSTWQARDAVRLAPEPPSLERDLYDRLVSRFPASVDQATASETIKVKTKMKA